MTCALLVGVALTNVTVTGRTPVGVVTVTALLLPLIDEYSICVSAVYVTVNWYGLLVAAFASFTVIAVALAVGLLGTRSMAPMVGFALVLIPGRVLPISSGVPFWSGSPA